MLYYYDRNGVWKCGFDLNRIWFLVSISVFDENCQSKVFSARSLVLNLGFEHQMHACSQIRFYSFDVQPYVSIPPSQLVWSSPPVYPNHCFVHLKWRKAIFVYSHNLSIVPGGESLWDAAHMNRCCFSRRHHSSLNSFLQSPAGPVNWDRTPGEHRRAYGRSEGVGKSLHTCAVKWNKCVRNTAQLVQMDSLG